MDSLQIALEIKDDQAEVVIGRNRQRLQDFVRDAEKLQPQIKFSISNQGFIDLDKLEKRAEETRKAFKNITTTRLDAGQINNLTRELVSAMERSTQLTRDIVSLKREIANPNRKSSIAFLIDELRAAEKEANLLNRKLNTLHPASAPGASPVSSGIVSAFNSNALLAGLTGGLVGAGAVGAAQSALGAVSALVGTIKDLSFEAVRLGGDFEVSRNSLTVFTGSAVRAREELISIDRVAQNTAGLDLESAEKGYTRLRALGFQADLTQKLIAGIAKQKILSGADEQAINRVIVNIQQLSSTTANAGRDLKEMIHALPSLRRVFQETFGTAELGKLKDLIQQNPEAFFQKLADGLEKAQGAQGGLNDSQTKFFDQLKLSGRSFSEPFLPELTKGIQDLTKLLAENQDTFKTWGENVRAVLKGINAIGAGNLVKDIASSTLSAALPQWLAELVKIYLAGNGGKLAGSELNVQTPQERVEALLKKEEQRKNVLERQLELIKEQGATLADLERLQSEIYKNRDAGRDTNSELGRTRDENDLAILKKIAEEKNRLKKEALTDSVTTLLNSNPPLDAARNKQFELLLNASRFTVKEYQSLAAQIDNFIKQSVESGKNKVKELEKTYLSVFDNLYQKLNSQNPFALFARESDKELNLLKENIKGLPKTLADAFLKMQSQASGLKLFELRLNNNLDVFGLRDEAANFRNPYDAEKSKKEQERYIQNFLARNPNYLYLKQQEFDSIERTTGYKPLESFEEFYRKDILTRGKSIFDSPQNRLNNRLDEQYKLIYGGKQLSAQEQSIADKKFISLTQGVNPLDLSDSLREKAALVREREAARRENYEKESLEVQKETLAVNKQLAANQKRLLEVAEKSGAEGIRLIIETDDGVKDVKQMQRPSQKDVQSRQLGLVSGSNGLTNY